MRARRSATARLAAAARPAPDGASDGAGGTGGADGAGGADSASEAILDAAEAAQADADASAPDASIDAPILTVRYVATVADCTTPIGPNPDTCETNTGTGTMNVDWLDAASNQEQDSFLRFDLDGVLAGKTVVAITLQLTVSPNAGAERRLGGDSGRWHPSRALPSSSRSRRRWARPLFPRARPHRAEPSRQLVAPARQRHREHAAYLASSRSARTARTT